MTLMGINSISIISKIKRNNLGPSTITINKPIPTLPKVTYNINFQAVAKYQKPKRISSGVLQNYRKYS